MTRIFINTALGTSDLVFLKHSAVLIYIWFNEGKLSNVQNFLTGKAQIFMILHSTSLLGFFFSFFLNTEDNSKQNPTHSVIRNLVIDLVTESHSFLFEDLTGLHSHAIL